MNDTCMFCDRSNANIKCCHVGGCDNRFHLPCGRENGALQQFFGACKTFCPEHRPLQDVPKLARLPRQCHICHLTWELEEEGMDREADEGVDEDLVATIPSLEEIEIVLADQRHESDVVWAPCCHFTVAFHWPCVQRLAENSGIFFKCPSCGDEDVFTPAMQLLGVYVPQKDPKWEVELNEERSPTISCSANPCNCITGENFNNKDTLWEMIRCLECASVGVHRSCGGLALDTSKWYCNSCTEEVSGILTNESTNKVLSSDALKRKYNDEKLNSCKKIKEEVPRKVKIGPKCSKKYSSEYTSQSTKIPSESSVRDRESYSPALTCQTSEELDVSRAAESSIQTVIRILKDAVFIVTSEGISEIYSTKYGFHAVAKDKNGNLIRG